MNNIKTIIKCIFSVLLIALSITSSYADSQSTNEMVNTDYSYNQERNIKICNLFCARVPEEKTEVFLNSIQWNKLSNESFKTGLIRGFAVTTNNKCALLINDLFLYEGQTCVAAYSFDYSGIVIVFSDDVNFYILFERENYILQFDAKDSLALYQEEASRATEHEKLDLLSGLNTSVNKGLYSVTNKKPVIIPYITGTYDTLLWEDTVLYETPIRIYFIAAYFGVHAIALFLVLKWLITKKANKSEMVRY